MKWLLGLLLLSPCPNFTTKTIEVYNDKKFIGTMKYQDDDLIYIFERFNQGTYNGVIWTDDFKYTFVIKKELNVNHTE